jgi:hypothetical protein
MLFLGHFYAILSLPGSRVQFAPALKFVTNTGVHLFYILLKAEEEEQQQMGCFIWIRNAKKSTNASSSHLSVISQAL